MFLKSIFALALTFPAFLSAATFTVEEFTDMVGLWRASIS